MSLLGPSVGQPVLLTFIRNGDEVRAIYEKYSAALTGGGQQTINMEMLEF